MIKSKEILDKVESPNHFVLAEGMYDIDLYLGLNENGQKTIKLRDTFVPQKIQGTNCLSIAQFKNEDYSTLQISLMDDSFSEMFYLFCDDLIKSLIGQGKSKNTAYDIMVSRFVKWKKMFVNAKCDFLTEPQVMGLIGEILFLKLRLFNKYNKTKALLGWSGQELTHKDFSFDNIWYEVKAVNKNSTTVKISSIEQLDSEFFGELVVVSLEKMSQVFKGITLNSLVKEIIETLNENDKDIFINQISQQGYVVNDYYDKFVYALVDIKNYKVEDGFPRLRRNDLNKNIVKAQYELSLLGIKKFITKE